MAAKTRARWIPVEIAGRRFERMNLEHPEVELRVGAEIDSGIKVYYNNRWPLTRRFCRLLLERPGFVKGRRVFIAGAGVGMESVVAGRLAASVTVNDLAPVALGLCLEQLERNGVRNGVAEPGPFEEVELEGFDLVVACFVVYNQETRTAMSCLLERADRKDIPVLLANLDIGGHFLGVLEASSRPVRDVDPEGKGRFVWVE